MSINSTKPVTPRPVEVLAPVGSAEMLSAAVYSGADAVYLGLTGFNARRSAGNFTPEALREAVCFCHARGVKVHVTLNTLVFAPELPGLADAVRAVAEAGADAVIVDDLAAAALVKAIAPGLALHGSTQMSVHTAAGVRQLAGMGFARAILARELSEREIAEITAASPIETEVFVHGALCMSMSGQCMMSAFLGGRSGNRGACAGPCRLPFDANPLRPGQPGQAYHLSLKDLDLIPHLPQLAAAGVASIKIEGRLRTPEYVAAAVTACRCARDGLPYDEQLVRDIFSRSGFTDDYFTGRIGRQMFGVRTAEDSAVTKKAEPKARELFRRELSRVPVRFSVSFEEEGVKLKAADAEGHTSIAYSESAPQPAQRDQTEAIGRALSKTGGTPFAVESIGAITGPATFLPAGEWNEMRRQCLESLLQKRSAPRPQPQKPYALPDFSAHTAAPGALPALTARFERFAQLPEGAAGSLAALIFPIAEAENIPAALRSKTVLELPRAMYGARQRDTAMRIAQCEKAGFAGWAANNIGQLALLAGTALPIYGGLGLNITNPLAAQECRALGLAGLLAHPETPFSAMAAIAPGIPTAAIAYGHLPLMLTRACPLQNVHSCAGCNKAGALRDRKGRDFPVRCGGGVRTVYNPVPLYLGDRQAELPADAAVLCFTIEPPARVAEVLALFTAGAPFDAEFTRGLYYKPIS